MRIMMSNQVNSLVNARIENNDNNIPLIQITIERAAMPFHVYCEREVVIRSLFLITSVS